MTRKILGRLEIVLPQSLKQQFFAECARRGYMPSRVLRLMMSDALNQWQNDEMDTLQNDAPINRPPATLGATNSDVMSAPKG